MTRSFNYAIRFKKESDAQWPDVWESGDRTQDEAFANAGVFIFKSYWSGGAPAVGDVFTFAVDPAARMISIPALYYMDPLSRKADEFTVDQINSLVDGDTIITGSSWGPGFESDQDLLQDYCEQAFSRAGFTNIPFADERFYHRRAGSIHCGTNAIRAIPNTKWWEFVR